VPRQIQGLHFLALILARRGGTDNPSFGHVRTPRAAPAFGFPFIQSTPSCF
jgi:hypothetical protein